MKIFYMESTAGRFNLANIQDCIKLIDSKETKRQVEQEIDWFNSPHLKPDTIQLFPNIVSINAFKSLIHNSPLNCDIEGMAIVPEELARLCCHRYISGDHIHWILKKLNQQNRSTLCVYLNEIKYVNRFVEKNKSHETDALFFIINVGRSHGKTFMGCNTNPGCHWTICSYESNSELCYYGDSLGWEIPEELEHLVRTYVSKCFNVDKYINIVPCHKPGSDPQHRCSNDCFLIYPLQTCCNVCGVVSIIVAVYFCLDRNFYNILVSKNQSNPLPNMFISKPTTYNKYLRQCIIAWFIEGHITIELICQI